MSLDTCLLTQDGAESGLFKWIGCVDARIAAFPVGTVFADERDPGAAAVQAILR